MSIIKENDYAWFVKLNVFNYTTKKIMQFLGMREYQEKISLKNRGGMVYIQNGLRNSRYIKFNDILAKFPAFAGMLAACLASNKEFIILT